LARALEILIAAKGQRNKNHEEYKEREGRVKIFSWDGEGSGDSDNE
jgi:hypothetical protein